MDLLRKRLQAMTQVEDVSQHPALLDEIRRECPNTIKLLTSPHPVGRFTCLVHVLGFAACPDYEVIASRGFNVVFAGRVFAHWLIDRGALTAVSEATWKTVILFSTLIKSGNSCMRVWLRRTCASSRNGVSAIFTSMNFGMCLSPTERLSASSNNFLVKKPSTFSSNSRVRKGRSAKPSPCPVEPRAHAPGLRVGI